MKSFSITDIGVKRKVNQDYVFCEENAVGRLPNLFIVADGMGGHNAGDYASRFCVEEVVAGIKNCDLTTPIGILEQAIKSANDRLLDEAQKEPGLEGMGTTFVAATILDHDLYVANIGDSRLYLIAKETIKQITEDHSLVEAMVKTGEIDRKDARYHPNKNVITRALGASKNTMVDYFEVQLNEGDIVLLCSDGLSNMIDDEEIMEIIRRNPNDLKLSANELVERANAYGGKDNIAIVLIRA